MGRPKGSKSPASRENGKKGGRPLARLPPTMLARLGPPPLDSTTRQSRWYSTALIMLTDLQLRGVTGMHALADEIRSNIRAAATMMPHDILFDAARKVREDEEDLASDHGPEEEEIERDPSTSRAVRSNG